MIVALMIAGIASSAAAQTMLKVASRFRTLETKWILAMLGGVGFYGISFVLYSLLLRKTELSRTGPIMTVGVMLVVAAAGILVFGERMDLRKALGIAMSVAALALLAG